MRRSGVACAGILTTPQLTVAIDEVRRVRDLKHARRSNPGLVSTPPTRSRGLPSRRHPRPPALAARALPRALPPRLARHPCSPRPRRTRARAGSAHRAAARVGAAAYALSGSSSRIQADITPRGPEDGVRAADTQELRTGPYLIEIKPAQARGVVPLDEPLTYVCRHRAIWDAKKVESTNS